MFCVKCGKKAEVGNFCEKCFLKRHDLFNLKNKTIRIRLCDCGRFFYKKWCIGDWHSLVTEDNIKTKNNIFKKEISSKKTGNSYLITVKATGFIKPCKKEKTEKREFILIVKKGKCDACTKIAGKYYEAVIQVRGGEYKKILEKIMSLIPKDDPLALTRIKEVKGGVDLFFGKKMVAKKIIKQLKNLHVKKTYKLVGQKKDKKIYRNYYSVRMIERGD